MSDSLNNKELVAVGHQFAKAMNADTPIIDMAKIVSRLAERLDCTTAALREMTKQRDALGVENAALKAAFNPEEIPEEAVEAFTDTAIMSSDWDDTGSWSWVENDSDVIRAVLAVLAADKTPATDAFLAEVRASTLEDLAKKKRDEKMSLHPDTFALGSVIAALDMQANELEDLAAQLRQEAAQ